MFCGLPVMVAVLPALDAIASTSRYGTRLRFMPRAVSTTSGVSIRHTVSLTSTADRIAANAAMPISSAAGRCAWAAIKLRQIAAQSTLGTYFKW